MVDKDDVKLAWEKEPIICKLVDFGESRGQLNQTATIFHMRTTNIDRGTPVYMAPELFSVGTASLTFQQLKMCDIWSFGMVLFLLLNPDLQYPYQLEIDKFGKSILKDFLPHLHYLVTTFLE
jgi:serine/threonine protein kinase